MTSATMVFGSSSRRSNQWRLYRIRTANSVYELEVEGEGSRAARRCVVLTCVEPAERKGEVFEDSSPLADGQSLYALSPLDWMGKKLSVGTAQTSPMLSVDFISAHAERRAITRVFPSGQSTRAAQPATQRGTSERERPSWAAFPAGYVEMAEAAASLLKCVCHRHDLAEALQHDEHLQQRLKLSFAECRLMLDALLRRPGV